MTVSFAPYISQREISVQEVYGGFLSTPDIPASIPKGSKAIAFRPPKKGERFLTVDCAIMVANSDYSESAPRIIVEVDLSEIEKTYGINATVESLWAHYCDTPSDYGKPTFDYVPEKRDVSFIAPIEVAGPEPRWIAHGYFWSQGPKWVWAYKLTDVEKVYGQGTTIEDLWKQYCPKPECYGKPRFGEIPKDIGHVGVVWQGIFPYFTDHFHEPRTSAPRIYAPYLNVWQRLYGEAIPDAAALEAKLRAEGKLGEHQFIEAELKPIDRDLWFVSKDPDCSILRSHVPFTERPFRAIVGTRKRGYIRIPYESFAKCLTSPMCGQVPVLLPGSEVVFYGVKGTYVEE